MNILEFEQTLARERLRRYRERRADALTEGYRPLSGSVADFSVIEHRGAHHVFYIERRLSEGTPFYPGNEIYFGHASTRTFMDWTVHDPVMHVRPGTWEGAHVWAPYVLAHGGRFVMAYTGVNDVLSQDIGLAFSDDLFAWKRCDRNPLSPCAGRPWSAWSRDRISSCRDPHLLLHDGKVWMAYTANTRDGASCIALASSVDLLQWRDHGPILLGPRDGYEPRLEGGHPQGSLESANLLFRGGTWHLLVHASVRGTSTKQWIVSSPTMSSFDWASRREFWSGGGCVELVASRGSRSLLAGITAGTIRVAVADWALPEPRATSLTPAELGVWTAASKAPDGKAPDPAR